MLYALSARDTHDKTSFTKELVLLKLSGISLAEETWLFELQLWVVSEGASWLIDLEPYESSRVGGIVERLRIDPSEGALEACVTDGTGTVSAQWTITRPTPQLAAAPGRRVILEGTAVVAATGELVFREPRFQAFSFARVA